MPRLHQPTYLRCSRSCRVWIRAFALILLALVLACGTAAAKVTGPCSNCHTMHYSQNNTILAEWDTGGPHQALLRSDCVGCHSGTNTGTAEWDTPHVNPLSGAPTYNTSGTESDTTTLAGGSFYWVNQPASGSIGGDAAGHNVAGISSADATLSFPPGFDGGRPASDNTTPGNGTWPSDQQVTCAGIYGCHGTHAEGVQTTAIHGAHHGDLGGDRSTPGNDDPATGYRFLVGIAGYEDSDWEFQPSATAHNQYKGFDRASSMDNTDDSTISSLCARCHGAYHSGEANVGSGFPWLRHPTDYDMGNLPTTSDYRNYGGGGNYVPAVPVASEDVTAVKSSVGFANDTIITCVTCHRAHGSKYYKAMRWDYAGSITGGLCSECHSSKD